VNLYRVTAGAVLIMVMLAGCARPSPVEVACQKIVSAAPLYRPSLSACMNCEAHGGIYEVRGGMNTAVQMICAAR
jgi:hypothetical protein